MNMRPRCREWLPLATQQLRLRNLISIQGVNIEYLHADTLIYYTLHNSKESAPFYRSEALPQRHMQQKWAEITCAEMLKSNANCVCVKVWARLSVAHAELGQEDHTIDYECKEQISALSKGLSNACLPTNRLPQPPDKLLFIWGVYFSGLILVSQQADATFRANSLIFQMNGDYFASPELFNVINLRDQLTLNFERYSASLPKSSIPTPDELCINSPQVSRSSSPGALDWQRDLLRLSTARYTQLYRNHSDVRRSYTLEKLLRIQELQRLHLQKQRESLELTAEIKQISVRCITKEQILRKRRTTSLSSSSSLYHSMGRTLSVLLAEEQQIDPKALLRAQHLQALCEQLGSKQRLLQTEHSTYSKRIMQKQTHLSSLTESRQQLAEWLQEQCRQLADERDQLKQQDLELQRQAKRNLLENVERRMTTLCMELREIYPISRNKHDFHTICGIPLPNMDTYVTDAKYANSVSLEHVSPMALSAALGYVAHLVQMIAVIKNRPLRNPILHEGSRTRIMDIIKDIPSYTSREFPLYSRSAIPSKPVKYAIYLLNQNIAQLCYDITGIRCETRATVENILLIFAPLAEKERNPHEIHATMLTHPNNRLELHNNNSGGTHMDNGGDCLSKSHSSVDMQHMFVPATKISTLLQMPQSQPMAIAERSSPQQRICRSAGSYSDCEDNFKDIIDHCYSNSDSNIPFQSGHV